MATGRTGRRHILERFSLAATEWTGSSWAFTIAVGLILGWIATGPLFGFSDTWQLVINTGTTIITFLMVFLIQRAQNKEARAIHLKLNELVASSQRASNRLIDAEDLSESELLLLRRYYRELVALAKRDAVLTKSHTVEEAEALHGTKQRLGK
jgi:low affinity Fe/Cu permease